jgi:hypothetical protein
VISQSVRRSIARDFVQQTLCRTAGFMKCPIRLSSAALLGVAACVILPGNPSDVYDAGDGVYVVESAGVVGDDLPSLTRAARRVARVHCSLRREQVQWEGQLLSTPFFPFRDESRVTQCFRCVAQEAEILHVQWGGAHTATACTMAVSDLQISAPP